MRMSIASRVLLGPTFQRASANLVLVSTCTRKNIMSKRSSSVCRYLARGRGMRILFSQAYPEIIKITISTRSAQALILFILTSIRPYLIADHQSFHSLGRYKK
jgi:hypothetical protein